MDQTVLYTRLQQKNLESSTKSLPARMEQKDLYYYYSMLYTQYQPSRSHNLPPPPHTRILWSRAIYVSDYLPYGAKKKRGVSNAENKVLPSSTLAHSFVSSTNQSINHGSIFSRTPQTFPPGLPLPPLRTDSIPCKSAIRTRWVDQE